MNLFPQEDLSDTEKNLLAERLDDPLIKRYFKLRASNIASAIMAAIPDATESPEVWFRKELFLKGQMEILEELYTIKPLHKPTQE